MKIVIMLLTSHHWVTVLFILGIAILALNTLNLKLGGKNDGPPPRPSPPPSPPASASPPTEESVPPPAPPSALSPTPPAPKKSGYTTQHKLNRVRLKRPGLDGREYDATVVNVFYATDRSRDSGEGIKYGSQQSPSGKLEYGECEVSIPDTHVMGGMESPALLRFEFRPDPDKHIVLWKTASVEEEMFYEKVKASVAQSELKDAFVFVHGYNVRLRMPRDGLGNSPTTSNSSVRRSSTAGLQTGNSLIT